MESVDFKGLYESYRSVYTEEVEELDEMKEGYTDPKFNRKEYLAKLSKRGGMGMGTKEDPQGYRDPKMTKVGAEFVKRTTARSKSKKSGEPDEYKTEKESQSKLRSTNESTDLYDLVLEYLLDEGLCESVENAEIMMAHMSESWVESIIDEAATIMAVKSPKGEDRKVSKFRSGQETSQQIQNRAFSQMLSDRQKERQNRMNSGRATVARKRGIEKATNRSERLHDFVPGEAHYRIEDDGTIPTDYRARRRRASGR
jgi:hypothetical protein